MTQSSQPGAASASDREPAVPLWWCNFCGFKTDDRRAYLAHSCSEILEQRGESPEPGSEKHCR